MLQIDRDDDIGPQRPAKDTGTGLTTAPSSSQ